MAQVIDTLILELGLDPAKFTQGQKDALEAFHRSNDAAITLGKSIESQGAKTADFFANLKRGAVGLLAVFLGGRGIQEFVGYITHLDAATGRMARTMNMSVRELSAWQGAAEQTGGSAESITGTLSGVSSEMNKFMLTGQTSMLPLLNSMGIGFFDANKQMKSANQLLLEMADHIKGMDPARAAALLSMVPGMNQDTINLLTQGREAVEKYLAAARLAGGTTRESAAAAAEYQRNLALLDRQASATGRTLLNAFAPGATEFMKGLQNLFSKDFWSDTWAALGARNEREGNYMIGKRMLAREMDAQKTEAAPHTTIGGAGAAASAAEQEAYIRKAAIARGIDPDQAVRVARSEGLGGAYIGDRGSSFGPFQLHYGGMAGGGMAVGGLGDAFTKQTGLDAKNPATWQAQVDFSLDKAKKTGWGDWHGWRGAPFAGIGAPAAAGVTNNRTSGDVSHTTSVTVGKVEVHTTASDGDGIARDIKPALERASFAASANNGLQ